MPVKVKAPAVERLNGTQLARELRAAGYSGVSVVQVNGDIEVDGLTANGAGIDERSRSKVEAVVAAHNYVPVEEQVAQLRADLTEALARLATLEQRAVLKPVVGK